MRKAAKLAAQRLIAEHGIAAYEKVVAAERVVRRKQDKWLANFLADVVRQIERQTGCSDAADGSSVRNTLRPPAGQSPRTPILGQIEQCGLPRKRQRSG
jgi:hypothetical protein